MTRPQPSDDALLLRTARARAYPRRHGAQPPAGPTGNAGGAARDGAGWLRSDPEALPGPIELRMPDQQQPGVCALSRRQRGQPEHHDQETDRRRNPMKRLAMPFLLAMLTVSMAVPGCAGKFPGDIFPALK